MKEKILRCLRTKAKDIIQETQVFDMAYSTLRKEVKSKISKVSPDIATIVKTACLIAIFIGGYSDDKSDAVNKAIGTTINYYDIHVTNHYHKRLIF